MPTQLWILIVLVVVFGVALDRTTFGRTLYAIGANETAARFSALNVDRTKLIVYTLSGLAVGPRRLRARLPGHDDAHGHGHGL